jgi:hypothetical protein
MEAAMVGIETYLTVTQFVDELHLRNIRVGREAVLNWIVSGALSAVKLPGGPKSMYVIPEGEIERILRPVRPRPQSAASHANGNRAPEDELELESPLPW